VGLDTCQESQCSEGEANDRGVPGGKYPAAGLDLGGEQLALLAALRAAHPATPIVAVLFNGGPVSSPWLAANADAILESWYPGLEGGTAIVDALLGAAIPAGRMPVTTVRSMADLPPHTDFVLATPPGRTHRYATLPPLYPFGLGLSYVNFTYSALTVNPASVCASAMGSVSVSAVVARAATSEPAFLGAVPADEVVQLYGASGAAAVPGVTSPPLQQLLAFRRLAVLGEGEAREVAFALGPSDFSLYLSSGRMGVQAGNWSLTLGGGGPSSEAYGAPPVLRGSIEVRDC
jgi:beta-glucosidase